MTNKNSVNDDSVISIKLNAQQWIIVMEWLSHIPFKDAHDILVLISETSKKTDSTATEMSIEMPIRTANAIFMTLSMAPYYQVAEILKNVFDQSQQEINKLKNTPVEESDDKTDIDKEQTN